MQEIQSQESSSPVAFDDHTKHTLLSTAKIAGIAAFLSLAGALAGLVAYFIRPKEGLPEGLDSSAANWMTSGNSLSNLIFTLGLSAVLFIFLNRFSVLTKKGIESASNQQLEKGLASLATYFKICAIIIIFVLGLVVVVSIAMGLGTAMS